MAARPAGRTSLTFLLAALAALALAGDAVAHDPIEEAFARGERPRDSLSSAVAWAALAVFLGASAFSGGRRFRPAARASLRHSPLVAQLLSLWISSVTSRAGPRPPSEPRALGGVWLFVLGEIRRDAARGPRGARSARGGTRDGGRVRRLLPLEQQRRRRSEAVELPPAGELDGFVVLFSAYGPLAVPPNVEFWIPQLTLFGAVSLGVALVVATAAALMGLNWAASAYALRRRCRGGGLGAGVGWRRSGRTSAAAARRPSIPSWPSSWGARRRRRSEHGSWGAPRRSTTSRRLR